MQGIFRLTILVFAVASLALSARPNGQGAKPSGTPNFTGTWKANIEKSTFGPSPVPESMVYKIDHQEPSLKITSTRVDQGAEDTVSLSLTTDGKENSNIIRGAEVKSKAKWDGPALLIDSVTTAEGSTFGLKDKWTLSDDGKTFTWVRHFISPDGGGDATYILEKQ